MRRRVRSRVLTSARTATRTFDLQLAIATLRFPAPAYVEIGTNPNASGSVWRQQGGTFCGSRPRQAEGRSQGNAFVDTGQKQALWPKPRKCKLCLILLASAEGCEPSTLCFKPKISQVSKSF